MLTINQLDDLSTDELERIRSTLRKKYRAGRPGDVIEVAFGYAEKNHQLDPHRPQAFCFYVRHKRTPQNKAARIPGHQEVRVRRGNHFVLVRLPTDVIEIDRQQVRITGRSIKHVTGSGPGKAGCVVAWKLAQSGQMQWGVLTVGHVFSHVSKVPESGQRVLIESATNPSHRFKGTLMARSRPRDGSRIDAALVQVSRQALVRARLIPPGVSTEGKRVRTVNQLARDAGQDGYSFPRTSRLPFEVARYLPVSTLVDELGPLRHVIEARGDEGTFGTGRSGSLWVVQRQVACIQHAGLSPRFVRGWGQALESILAWVAKQLGNINRTATNQVDVRLIRII